MILTKEQALEQIKAILGDKVTEDTSIKLIEDMTDTLDAKAKDDNEDWKAKYEENDKAWRKKYTDRFFNSPANGTDDKDDNPIKDPEKEVEQEANAPKTFDDLFKEDKK